MKRHFVPAALCVIFLFAHEGSAQVTQIRVLASNGVKAVIGVLSAGVRNSEPGQLAAEAGMRLASVSL